MTDKEYWATLLKAFEGWKEVAEQMAKTVEAINKLGQLSKKDEDATSESDKE